jgi:hypothetical protein
MGDALTLAAADVGSSMQTLAPVIRGRCRERPSEREAQNRVEEWPSVVPAGGLSLDSVFGVGSNPVAPTMLQWQSIQIALKLYT